MSEKSRMAQLINDQQKLIDRLLDDKEKLIDRLSKLSDADSNWKNRASYWQGKHDKLAASMEEG